MRCIALSQAWRWCWCWCHRRLPASLAQLRRHFPLSSVLIDGAEASSCLSSLLLPRFLTDAPLSANAPARPAPLLKLRLNPSFHGGFSMYGCARKNDAVGWPKTEWNIKKKNPISLLWTFKKEEPADPGAVLNGQRIQPLRSSSLNCWGKTRLVWLVFHSTASRFGHALVRRASSCILVIFWHFCAHICVRSFGALV